MAEIDSRPTITTTGRFTVSEAELRALKHIADFGGEAVVEALSTMSPAAKSDHGPVLVDFFNDLRGIAGSLLLPLDNAKRQIQNDIAQAMREREAERAQRDEEQ